MKPKLISKINIKCSISEKSYYKHSLTLNTKSNLDSLSINDMVYKELEISSPYYDIIPLRVKGLSNKKGLLDHEDNETG